MIYREIQLTLMSVSALIMISIFIYTFTLRQERGARYFAWIMLLRATFATSVIMEITSDSLWSKLLFRNIQQSAITLTVPFIPFFVLGYLGKTRLLKPLGMFAFFLIFAVWTVLIWLAPYHHLIRKAMEFDNGQLVVIRAVPAVLFNFFGAAVIIASLIYLSSRIKQSSAIIRKHVTWIWIYFTVPVVIQLAKLARPQLTSLLVPVTVYSGLLGLITFWVIFRHKLFSIVPISRDKVLETMQEGVLVVDMEGIVVDKNTCMSRFFMEKPAARSPVIGRHVRDLLGSWPIWRDACERMERETMEIETGEPGELHVHTVNVYPLFSERGRKWGTTSVLADITESRNRYKQVVELNQMKDRLFTIVSHDIRDPLAVLINLTDLLEEEKPHLSEDSNEVIDAVTEQVRNTYIMVENLLEWFRSQRKGMVLHRQSWELAGIVREAVHMLRIKSEAKGIVVRIGIENDIQVFADRESVNLIVRNLLSNAIKFTRPEGMVHIDAQLSNGMAAISVEDNGVGIEQDKVRQLFDYAHWGSSIGTAGEKGTGLGLLVCKELVQMSGGTIRAESAIDQGSVFHFTLPYTRS